MRINRLNAFFCSAILVCNACAYSFAQGQAKENSESENVIYAFYAEPGYLQEKRADLIIQAQVISITKDRNELFQPIFVVKTKVLKVEKGRYQHEIFAFPINSNLPAADYDPLYYGFIVGQTVQLRAAKDDRTNEPEKGFGYVIKDPRIPQSVNFSSKEIQDSVILEAAVKSAGKEGIALKDRKITIDSDNRIWQARAGAINKEMAANYEFLKNLKYQAVCFSLRPDAPRKGGDFWVFIDKYSGELLTLYGEE